MKWNEKYVEWLFIYNKQKYYWTCPSYNVKSEIVLLLYLFAHATKSTIYDLTHQWIDFLNKSKSFDYVSNFA